MRTRMRGLAAACLILAATPVAAQDMVYEPINPSFGGNPFNSAHLLGVAGAINDYKDPNATSTTGASQSDLFARQLQSRLLSALSSQITNAIFGENAQESGNVNFGGQQIAWVRTLESVTVTITDDASGSETVIEVPTFIEVN
ncbi:MAG TPA: curli assembly protein CsgF [Phenylobacterium sp.]